MEAKNIDDIIVSDMTNKPVPMPATESAKSVDVSESEGSPGDSKPADDVASSSEPTRVSESTGDSPIDEYGNPIVKPRVYTEEEVQRMIRERLSRGRHAEQQLEEEVRQPQENQKEEVTEEDWRTTLKNEVRNINQELQRETYEQQWKREERERQANFEERFTSGMGKYSDFREVIAGKNITDAMMMATRNLDNPAAFIYGAAKLHPKELERISGIADPYAQASEVGRLHEKMVKAKSLASNAPRPVEVNAANMPTKDYMAIPIDQRIIEHAKSKRK